MLSTPHLMISLSTAALTHSWSRYRNFFGLQLRSSRILFRRTRLLTSDPPIEVKNAVHRVPGTECYGHLRTLGLRASIHGLLSKRRAEVNTVGQFLTIASGSLFHDRRHYDEIRKENRSSKFYRFTQV